MNLETISAKDLEQYIGEKGVLIIDLREKEEYREGHIDTAINIPYDMIDQYAGLLYRYELVILYCERGNSSLLAAKRLCANGVKTASVLGGIHLYRGRLVHEI